MRLEAAMEIETKRPIKNVVRVLIIPPGDVRHKPRRNLLLYVVGLKINLRTIRTKCREACPDCKLFRPL